MNVNLNLVIRVTVSSISSHFHHHNHQNHHHHHLYHFHHWHHFNHHQFRFPELKTTWKIKFDLREKSYPKRCTGSAFDNNFRRNTKTSNLLDSRSLDTLLVFHHFHNSRFNRWNPPTHMIQSNYKNCYHLKKEESRPFSYISLSHWYHTNSRWQEARLNLNNNKKTITIWSNKNLISWSYFL